MGPRLIDLRIRGVKTFKDQEFYVNFRNNKRVSYSSHDRFMVSPIKGNNYTNNVIAFAGINASGKTTALKLIDLTLNVFIQGMDINLVNELPDLLADEISVSFHLVFGNTLCHLEADLMKKQGQSQADFIFAEERIMTRELRADETHAGLLDSHKYNHRQLRSELERQSKRFLKDTDSMLPSLLREYDKFRSVYIGSTIKSTNFNFLLPSEYLSEERATYATELLAYLDESIESLSIVEGETARDGYPRIRLKFFNKTEITTGFFDLVDYLSSGTVRGLIVFDKVIATLKMGGYVLIDELELHFNKVITENVISLFQSDLNIHGATLVFSTHYSELLDRIRRKDAIMVLAKSEHGITSTSLDILSKEKDRDRTDIQNSDLILSGIFKTAPSYNKYMAVKSRIADSVLNRSSEREIIGL